MHAVGKVRAFEEAVCVSHRAFRFIFCFFTGRAYPASNRKTSVEKQAEIPLSGRIFFGMRGEIRRDADNCAAFCGEKECLLRQAARALAERKR